MPATPRGNTIEATGAKSKIDLSSLSTFAGGGNGSTQIEALSGGEVDLGGAFSGCTDWTPDATGGKFNAAKVTKLADATLNVTAATLTFTARHDAQRREHDGLGGRADPLPGGHELYQLPTWGNTIEATGAKSKIDLSSLEHFRRRGQRCHADRSPQRRRARPGRDLQRLHHLDPRRHRRQVQRRQDDEARRRHAERHRATR